MDETCPRKGIYVNKFVNSKLIMGVIFSQYISSELSYDT